MRNVFRKLVLLSSLLFVIAPPSDASDFAVLEVLIDKIDSSQVQCPNPNDSSCVQQAEQCKRTIDGQKTQVRRALTTAQANEVSNGVQATASANTTLNANGGDTNQSLSAEHLAKISSENAARQAMVSAAGKQLTSKASSCAKAIESACSSPVTGSDQAEQACVAMAANADAIANKKSLSGMEMMQMAQMGMGIMNGLNSLANKPKGNGDSKISGTGTPNTMTMNGVSGGRKLGFQSTSKDKTGASSGSGAGAGGGPLGVASRDFAAEASKSWEFPYQADGSGGISDKSGSGASAASASVTGASTGGGEAPEGKVLENTKGTENVAAMEFGYGGGGGARSSLLGLKGNKNDLDSLLPKEEDYKPELGTPDFEGDRSLASAEAGADVLADPEVSLFTVVRSKLKDMKKRGYL